jgi:aminoglycoside phosphotransferase (APT) family kinase protein
MSQFDHFVGTRPVTGTHAFDVLTLERWLLANMPGFEGPLSVEMFKGGQSNPTYKLITPQCAYVMRAKPGPVAKLLPSAHAIEREFAVMKGLAGTAVPVAHMHVLCEDESIIGRAFYVMEFVAGRVLWDQSLPGMTTTQRGEIYDEMNRVIAQLHSSDYKKLDLESFGKPGNYFGRQIDRWIRQYKAAETEHIPEMEHLIEWLPKNIPAGEITTIVHGDYRLDNMIFHPTEPRILAVLDWELSTLGHPLADFSYHCMSWHVEPDLFRGIGGLDLKSLGIPSRDDYIARYSERTGISINKDDFRFYLAYNMFRMAGILQGIMKRYQDGTASSEQALKSGQAAKPMAIMGWQYASGQKTL